jgi:hypothetical protein
VANRQRSCPLTQRQQIDTYFLETRNRVLEVAAFLDRLDRAADDDAAGDFRLVALREALAALAAGEAEARADRVRQVQLIFSDQNCELLETLDQKSAYGAAKPR